MEDSKDPVVYQFKVTLLHVSPLIWRRILVKSDTTIADFHYILQTVMGWDDDHFHQFIVYGKSYGIAYDGGLSFSDNPRKIRLSDFSFRLNERFMYEYDFNDNWKHQVRLEAVRPLDSRHFYPTCIAGKRLAPPEDIGGPVAFMTTRDHYHRWEVLNRLVEILKKKHAYRKHRAEMRELSYWLLVDSMNRKRINEKLKDLFHPKE